MVNRIVLNPISYHGPKAVGNIWILSLIAPF